MIQKKYVTAAKVAISSILIWIVVRHVEMAPVASRLSRLGLIEIGLCILPLAAQLPIVAARWSAVSARLGVVLRFVPALEIVTIGTFFNQTLPSAVGGDAVRIWMIAREGIGLVKAVNSVFCDRVVGLVALLGISAATLPLFYERVTDPPARQGLTAFLVIGLVGFVLFLFLGGQIAFWLQRWRLTRPLGDLAHDFYRLFTAPLITTSLTICSVSVHLLTIVDAWTIANALGIGITLIDCAIMIPPVILITLLPISIAGWGLREGVMVVGFGLVGVTPSDAVAVSICFGLANILVGLPGGLLWLRSRPANAAEITPARD